MKHYKRLRVNRFIVAMVFVLWPLPSAALDSGEFLVDAQSLYKEGEYSAAVIQLKNALLADPDNAQARLLLGQAYLKLGEGSSAHKELSRAQTLGVNREVVLEPLGRALLMMGKGDELVKTFFIEDGDPEPLRVDILLLQGQAYFSRQHFQLANDKFSEVLERDPAKAEALLGKARIAYRDKDNARASEFIDRAIILQPDNADAWTLKGELLRSAGQPQESVSAFQKALDIEPGNVITRMGMASTLIMLGTPDKALEELNRLDEKYSRLYLVNYLKALAYFQQQQLDQAQELVQLALKQSPNHLPSHLLAGTIAYRQGQMNQAEQHLRTYFSQVPDNPQATKLLAATLMKLREPGKVIEVMEPGASAAADDAQYLAMLGSAWLAMGDASKGIEYLGKAVALEPDMAALRTQLAVGQLLGGDTDRAVSELQAAVDMGQDLFRADIMLVQVYLKKNDFDNALIAAGALAVKMPESPVPLNMKGAALLGKGDQQGAKNAFEAAIRMQPDFLPAHLNLAGLDLMKGDTVAAQARYQKVLSYDAANLKALLAQAALAERLGQIDEAERWLKEAHKHHPDELRPALLLVEHYLRQGDEKRAMDMARTIVVAWPRDPNALRAQAMVQFRIGDDKSTLATLRTLTEVAPRSPEARYLLAILQLKQKQDRAARSSLQQALLLRADYPVAQLALGRIDIAEKDYDAALVIADALQKTHPEAAFADELKGDVYFDRKELPLAAAAYSQAYAKTPSAQLATKLYHSLGRSGETERAHEALRGWLAVQPDDIAVRGMLATSLQNQGMNPQAAKEYLLILEQDKDNIAALNNIAWLYQDAGNPEGLKYAERAHALVPDRPEVIDTFGWLLVQNGELDRGLVLLQEAAVKAPHIPDIRYHMIIALDKAGRREEARKELERLLKTGKTFPDIDKARALQEQWGG